MTKRWLKEKVNVILDRDKIYNDLFKKLGGNDEIR
jgi:hypothetical protein